MQRNRSINLGEEGVSYNTSPIVRIALKRYNLRSESAERLCPMLSNSFWRDKKPCWEILGCSVEVSCQCIAHQEPARPCWEYLETQCKKVLTLPVDCKDCKIFKLYGG